MMFIRYTPEELLFLKDSPLVVVPAGMPSKESYMGAPPDQNRNNANARNDRNKNFDGSNTTEQARRPTLDRHASRPSTTNPEDIILGPPKTAFMSSKGFGKGVDLPERPPLRSGDSKDRFSFRRERDGEDDRPRDGRQRDTRPQRQGDGDDSESGGWSKVKPRKSFGADGAERFTGRMGIQDRKYSHREERDNRPSTFENFARGVRDSKENDDDRERDRENRLARNGIGRGRSDMTWREREAAKEREVEGFGTPRDRNSNGDKYADRNRGWREKDKDEVERDRRPQRNDYNDRGGGGRWGRGPEEERKPEWMDEPKEEKSQARTAEEFQKWKEQMHKDKGTAGVAPAGDEGHFQADAGASFFGLEKEKAPVELSPPIESGPDKFFGTWGSKEERTAEADAEPKEGPQKSKAAKSSRFTSFFSPVEEPVRRSTEPPLPVPGPPPGGLAAFFTNQNTQATANNAGLPIASPPGPSDPSEKEAFNNLLALFKQNAPARTPQPNVASQPRPPMPEQNQLVSPEPFGQYRQERQEDSRPSTRHQQDIMAQRQATGSQGSNRQDQMLHDMIAQRQSSNSQSSSRPDQQINRNNTDFLMNLIQNTKVNPEPPRGDQQFRQQQPRLIERQLHQQALEREQMDMARERALREAAEQRLEREQHIDMVRERELRERVEQRERERAAHSQQQRRPGPPPGFYEQDPAFQRSHMPPPQDRQQSGPPLQPTQILQRPPPPGIDGGWDNRQPPPGPPQSAPPQQQHRMNVPPPPGLQSGVPSAPGRGPPQMFPPGFAVNSFPPPEGMPVPGPGQGLQRGMMQPPPGFYAGPGHQGPPPPGFMPPGIGGFGGPGPGMEFVGFDGRGPPPPPPQGFRR